MVSPVALHFDTDVDEMLFNMTNDGGGDVGDLTVALSGSLPAWLTITPDNVDQTTGLGTYVAQIDRSLLPSQPSAGTLVTFDYQKTDAQNVVTTGSTEIPVLVYTQSFTADTGYLYVQLLPVNTLNEAFPLPLRAVGVQVSSGQYRYSLNRVPSGRYVITAGSDLNNNDYLSDRPDAKGDYPFLGHPSIIDVGGGDIQGLDFTSGYNLYYSTSRPVSK
jgi:serine protease